MSDYTRVSTSAEVWAVIHARHKDLIVFSSFSDPDGTFNGGSGETGRMETSYGFKGSDCPLMEYRQTWSNVAGSKKDVSFQYYLCLPQKDDE